LRGRATRSCAPRAGLPRRARQNGAGPVRPAPSCAADRVAVRRFVPSRATRDHDAEGRTEIRGSNSRHRAGAMAQGTSAHRAPARTRARRMDSSGLSDESRLSGTYRRTQTKSGAITARSTTEEAPDLPRFESHQTAPFFTDHHASSPESRNDATAPSVG